MLLQHFGHRGVGPRGIQRRAAQPSPRLGLRAVQQQLLGDVGALRAVAVPARVRHLHQRREASRTRLRVGGGTAAQELPDSVRQAGTCGQVQGSHAVLAKGPGRVGVQLQELPNRVGGLTTMLSVR